MRHLRTAPAYLNAMAALCLAGGLTALGSLYRRFEGHSLRDEAGNVITDNLAWIVFGVVTIVAIGALLKVLGANVVNWATTQLGV